MSDPRSELLSAFSWLLASGKYSDLTIVCGSRRYAVHKALLCSRSRFFDGACSRGFHEASTGIIDLSDDDEEAVQHMIDYFYNLDYFFELDEEECEPDSYFAKQSLPSGTKQKKIDFTMVEDPLLAQAADNPRIVRPPTPESPLLPAEALQHKITRSNSTRRSRTRSSTVSSAASAGEIDGSNEEDEEGCFEPNLPLHAKMYAIAEKYEIHGLKALARHKFELDCMHSWEHPDFADAIREVYDNTVDSDRGLRAIVIQTFRAHPQIALRKEVAAAIKDTPPLAFELYKVSNGMPV